MHIRRWETQPWPSRGLKLRRNPDLAPYSLIQGHNFLPDLSRLNLSWFTGGPGDSGVEFLIGEGAGVLISTITQGQYDIVGT